MVPVCSFTCLTDRPLYSLADLQIVDVSDDEEDEAHYGDGLAKVSHV